MKRSLYAAMAIGMLLALTARGDDLPAWLTERRIIGANDLEPIEAALNTAAYAAARIVARVETSADSAGFCTSSRVGSDLFLTNYHCFEFKPCDQIQFHLGYERGMANDEQAVFKCKEVLSTSLPFDYALYRVEFAGSPSTAGETKTYSFDNLELAIPDDDKAGLARTFTIPQTGVLTDLAVKVKITHSYIGDLDVELVSAAGTTVKLHDRQGGGAHDLDQTFTLASELADLRGQDPQGTWELKIKDLASGDEGKLDQVAFTVTTNGAEPAQQSQTAGAQPDDFPVATLWEGELVVDQPLILASHPSARPKEIDRGANCKLRSVVTEVVSERQTLTHTCDTEGGSSGSPVLDRDTGRIVALHWGGTDDYNMAIPMSKILEDLRAHVTPEILAELKIEH